MGVWAKREIAEHRPNHITAQIKLALTRGTLTQQLLGTNKDKLHLPPHGLAVPRLGQVPTKNTDELISLSSFIWFCKQHSG
jgi:hypothetical protein